jgi:hypothetical protein
MIEPTENGTAKPSPEEAPTGEKNHPSGEANLAQGGDNRLRRGIRKGMGWFFDRGDFPLEFSVYLLALIVIHLTLIFWLHSADYWIDPSHSGWKTEILAQLKWGPYWVCGYYAAYFLLGNLLLRIIHPRAAFVLWALWSFLYLNLISLILFHNAEEVLSPLFPQGYILASLAAIVLLAFSWAGMIWTQLKKGDLPLMQAEDPDGSHKHGITGKVIAILGVLCATGMVVLVYNKASSPQIYWRQIQPAHLPPARSSASISPDVDGQRVLLFGGTHEWTQETEWAGMNDTWVWDGKDWTQLTPQTSPAARAGAAIAFDPGRKKVVLFGGADHPEGESYIYYDDTWEWDGSNWTRLYPANGPKARNGAFMYYDPQREKILLFAGYSMSKNKENTFYDDLWEWDGETWRQIPLSVSRKDSGYALTYYPAAQTPMIADGTGFWYLRDQAWYQPAFDQVPPNRWNGRLAYHSGNQSVVLFGGMMDEKAFGDTWVFDGSDWKKVVSKENPPERDEEALFYDASRKTILLFGGYGGNGQSSTLADMWELVMP